ncbi:hypothetical protein VM1G_05351 [Cytospora mali]|uniref:Uncharacterized protein n=1 Tax=Cytospora mali TaxID=578113 RepID=A0A194W103_CYTMA|nr:hypothetical protein VM1G_05351 [Valsa mali]
MEWAPLQAFRYGEQERGGVHKSQVDGPGNNVDIARFQQPPERRMEPLSDEWFTDLDQSIDEITRLFEELRVAPPEPEEIVHIREAEDDLDAIQDDLMNCLTTLEDAKQRLRQCSGSDRSDDDPYKVLRPRSLDLRPSDRPKLGEQFVPHRKSMSSASASLGDAVMRQIFKWWQPYGSSCVRDVSRRCDGLGQKRKTEVDGRLIH